MGDKLKILFLCTGNSCRSQMAQGFARELKGETIEAHSAGTEPGEMNPLAIAVMQEAGVDISGQYCKHVSALNDHNFDYVVTVCTSANEKCPLFPRQSKIVHFPFDDPPQLAKDAADDEQALQHYRHVRDQIKSFIERLPQALDEDLK